MRLARIIFVSCAVLAIIFLIASSPKTLKWLRATDIEQLYKPKQVGRYMYAKRADNSSADAGWTQILTVSTVAGRTQNLAKILLNNVRVLCWIMTSPKTVAIKGKAVYETWAKRCNIFLFMSSEADSTIPNVVALNVTEGRDHLTMKTMKGFQYVWNHYRNEADWFMKADDDTFVIVENLRYLLAHHNPSDPIYFGFHFKAIVKQGYMSGGGGYVLSKESLRRVATEAMPKHLCQEDHGAEDVNMGRCLERVGVQPELSVDTVGRESFHPFNPGTHIGGGYPDWFYKYAKHTPKKGADCCSDYSITFHYVDVNAMYTLYYLIYRLHPFGLDYKFNASLIHSIFRHSGQKTYMKTIATLPSKNPPTGVLSDSEHMDKLQKFLKVNNTQAVRK